MKKNSSVFAMIARSSLYKNLLVMLLMAAAQIILFLLKLQDYENIGLWTLTGTVKDSYMIIPLIVGFLLISIFLGRTGCHPGSKQVYLLSRLQISEYYIIGLQSLYNFICYMIFWAVEVMVLVGAGLIYAQRAADFTDHTLVLAFYSNKLMHTILPMRDILGWLLLASMFAGFAVYLALFSYRHRHSSQNGLVVTAAFLGLAFASFPRGMGTTRDFVTPFIMIALHAILLNELKKIKTKEEEHEQAENKG